MNPFPIQNSFTRYVSRGLRGPPQFPLTEALLVTNHKRRQTPATNVPLTSILRPLPQAEDVGTVPRVDGRARVPERVEGSPVQPPRPRRLRLERDALGEQRDAEAEVPPLAASSAQGSVRERLLEQVALQGRAAEGRPERPARGGGVH